MRSWTSLDRRILLHFHKSVIDVFTGNIQNNAPDCESGGILLGTLHGKHLLITEATTPTKQDICLRYLFKRLPYGHNTIAQARWNASGGTVRYLGEWHSHPEDFPHPSGLDISEWRKLSKKRSDKRPMLAVIVGRISLHVELVLPTGETFTMSSLE